MTAIQQTAATIVEAIIADLADRSGFEWQQTDRDIQQLLRATWEKIIVTELTK